MTMEFTIDRAKWLRGEIKENTGVDGGSCLRDIHGNMCCLGFYLQACRISNNRLKNHITPKELAILPKQAEWLISPETAFRHDSNAAAHLMQTNDHVEQSPIDRWREKKIRELFKEQGIKVKFVGRIPV